MLRSGIALVKVRLEHPRAYPRKQQAEQAGHGRRFYMQHTTSNVAVPTAPMTHSVDSDVHCCFAVLFAAAAGALRCNAPLRRPLLPACAIVGLFVCAKLKPTSAESEPVAAQCMHVRCV